MKLQPDDRPRLSLGIGPGSDDAMGSWQSSLGDSPKGSRSSLGTRREIAGRLVARILEATRLVGAGKPPVSDGCTAVAQVFGRLTVANPPRRGG
ncbi:hypothetical protein B296_00037467 [Ensete ventricosum]|uniref:Uncharacterized protein n=1 Tax=Ensete ventricosum TaxID=4639 RepID=A0A426ZJB5_ENSVE|nr:hypothetical protein B296_00037467 [Ensete ventricosum]